MATGKRMFMVEMARDEDGIVVASVPGIPGCHTQGESILEATERIPEAIQPSHPYGG